MNPGNLKNNALFLSCWYERSRPVQLVCLGVLILSILALLFLTVTINEKETKKILENCFYILVWIQAIVLLVQGTLFAWQMASRERASETLDFHRNSPQKIMDKIVGLVFGSTWLEWAIFIFLFFVELPFVLLPKVSIKAILLFNASLLISGVFFHTAAVTMSLLSTHKKRGSSLLGLLVFLWLGLPLFTYGVSELSPFFSYLFGVTAFSYIFPNELFQLQGWFYTLKLPLLAMQALVQVPLFLLMASGMKRIFSLPNSPALSKANVIRLLGFLLFFLTGFFVADYVHFEELLASGKYLWGYYSGDLSLQKFFEMQVWCFVSLFVAVGILVSFFLVPTYFKCAKYAMLKAKGLIRKEPLLDDGATSLLAVIIYLCLGGVFFMLYLIPMHASFLKGALCFLWISSYVIGFAGFLEYFRLGRFRNKKIFFMTVLLIWWVIIPWIIAIFFNYRMEEKVSLMSVTPFIGVGQAISLLFKDKGIEIVAFLAPWAVACFMWLLAVQERTAVEKSHKR